MAPLAQPLDNFAQQKKRTNNEASERTYADGF